jgi:ribosomal protein L6P/L9E
MNNRNNSILKNKLLLNKLQPRVYTKSLFLKGRGYKCSLNHTLKTLSLKIGFSHSIQKYIPNDISIYTKKGEIFFKSYNYLLLKSFSLKIKKLKKVNMYKKKGLFFSKEIIRLKQVKKK